MGAITFVTGGARSGKSTYAEGLAAASGAPVVYLATMEPGDDELAARVALHRSRRPEGWDTVEEPLAVVGALTALPPGATVLLECVSLWVSNLLFAAIPDPAMASAADWAAMVAGCDQPAGALLAAQANRPGALIAVSNEVGLGIVPADALSRAYRDALGLVNQRLCAEAERAVLMVSGRAIELPPPGAGPVTSR